ncbi:DUF4367 domain-containing protein [Paenibacillus donghaensis]|uniref:DUF4367 domain-containing protein n=1 Tax=Paenibacillus donghaensis TaxID=414771 RepID=UPI0018847E20|nr:DUF4367 domain-containing protein [Paenibacillus donghaensis]MBE9916880.1 DUF4367 domain-containing protein [Paenibacillus donghaensis]
MSQNKRQHGHFAEKMDSYLKEGSNSSGIEEYNQLFEIGRMLASQDYSKQSDKEAMFRRLLHKHDKEKNKEKINIKKKRWTRIAASATLLAAVGIISLFIVQPSFASDLVDRIINTISLGHISVSQTEPPERTAITEEMKKQAVVMAHDQEALDSNTLVVNNAGQLNEYTSFKVLLPSYQPEGYVFDRAEFYKDEQGNVSNSKYINIYYKNSATSKEIFLQQRYADEETAFAASTTHKIQAIKINGADAVMSGEHTIDWEANGVLYTVSAKGLANEEVIKIAESIRK